MSRLNIAPYIGAKNLMVYAINEQLDFKVKKYYR